MTHSAHRVGASSEAIQHHYDVGNDFYALWLDHTLTYSCAMYENGDEPLEQAQRRKLDYIATESGSPGAHRVLDIGCGWGGMMAHLADKHQVQALVGLTLSEEQAKYIHATYGSRFDVHQQAWQAHQPSSPYDAIVSVGAFEHFARPDQSDESRVAGYREFFRLCHQWLNPGARLCLQTICYDTADRTQLPAFFRESVFRESDLPRPHEILAAIDGLFHLNRLRNDAADYAKTLLQWRTRLWDRRQDATAIVGEAMVHHYLKYLGLSHLSFHTRSTGLLRITLTRADSPGGTARRFRPMRG